MEANCLSETEEGEELDGDKARCWKAPDSASSGGLEQMALLKFLLESNQPFTAY